MKIQITVDVDYIDEEGNIDDEVKASIIQGVKDSISKDCLSRVETEASTQINQAISESIASAKKLIEGRAIKVVEDWLDNEITPTDKWGEQLDPIKIMDLIKQTFDGLLNKRVDSSGRFDSRHGNSTLLSWITKDRIEVIVSDRIRPLEKDIDKKITAAVNAGIREKVSNKFAEMVIETARADHKAKPIAIDS